MSQFDSLFSDQFLEQNSVLTTNSSYVENTQNYSFQDLTAFSSELRAQAVHRANILRYLADHGVESFTLKHIEPHVQAMKEKFGNELPS